MNCRQFETVVNDVVRERPLEAGVREDAVAHAADCPRCAARLADERALTGALRLMAAGAAAEAAPPRLEAALREAFRTGATRAVGQEAARRAPVGRWPRWAAAAAIVLLSGAVALQLRPTPVDEKVAEVAPGRTSEPSRPDVPAPPSVESFRSGPPSQPVPHVPVRMKPSNSASAPRAAKTGGALKGARPVGPETAEISTDFLPVAYGGGFGPLESGQVLRVVLPRSALASVGLPMNADRAGERVKADVVVGHDGLVRAIRFVR